MERKKILLIEDEEILIDLYREVLEEQGGFQLLTSRDALEGLEIARKEKPNLILLDLLLPEYDGEYFLEKRLEDPLLYQIPVVVFTNWKTEGLDKQLSKYNILGIISKADTAPQELLEKVREYLKE